PLPSRYWGVRFGVRGHVRALKAVPQSRDRRTPSGIEQRPNLAKIDISHVTILLGGVRGHFDCGERLFAIACALAEN
ncbi:MAG: hypothetical protein ACREIW_08975, partial [Chthoniobacterales bacterium]